MTDFNRGIRLAAGGAGVHLWQVAEKMGISEFTLSRKLRHELSEEEKNQILKIIKNLEKEEADVVKSRK